MPTNVPLQSLSERLNAELAASWDPRVQGSALGDGALQRSLERFGASAGAAGIQLSDAFSAATAALAGHLDRLGIPEGRIERWQAFGMGLEAMTRGHANGSHAGEIPALQVDQFPGTHHARLDALHRINRAATSNLRLEEMLDTVARVVKSTTRSDACAIFLYNEATMLLSLEATDGLNADAVGKVMVRIGEGIVGRAAIEGKAIAASNARHHESFLIHPAIGDDRYASQVSVPLMLQGQNRLVGVLNIHSIEPRTYTTGELEFLKTVAGELAISIENARQYELTDQQLHQKIEELGTLQRITRTLASTLNLSDVLKMITQNAMQIVNADAAAIFRPGVSQPTIEARIGAIRQLDDVQTRSEVVGRVIETGATVKSDLNYTDGSASLYCMPLRSAQGTVGAICFRMKTTQELPKDTLELMQAFSDSAAMAIVNATLYENAMNSLHTQRTLVQEMHHRVRNNLQTVAALLSLQLRRSEDEPWAFEIREAISRIQSIAAVHDLLSDAKRLSGTTVDVLARMVAEDAHSTLIPPTLQVTFDIVPTDLEIPTKQATIMSLLINELASNAINHGFENRETGYIRIRGWEENGTANVEVFNDGARVPEGFDPSQSQGLGMKITYRLVTSDLHGTFNIWSDDKGTYALIRFPLDRSSDGIPA